MLPNGQGIDYGIAVGCTEVSGFCILVTPWEEFEDLKTDHFTAKMKHPNLVDCWRVFGCLEFGNKPDCGAIGIESCPRFTPAVG